MGKRICVVGAGKWGTNHIKSLHKLNALGGIVDLDKNKLDQFKAFGNNLVFCKSLDESFANNFDGYIVATPTSTHFTIAKQIIMNGKPLLVEKPLTLSLKEGKEIEKLLLSENGKLIVGHLLLFHPAIQKIDEIIKDDQIGNIQYIYSNRLNQGVVRKDENVFWSFAPHDIAIFQFLTNSFPDRINSIGGAFIREEIHDTTMTYLKYPNGIQGHIYVSWLHPFKEHRLVIIGTKGSIHFEDSLANKPLLLYKKNMNTSFDKDNIICDRVEYSESEPLMNQLSYFIDIINGKKINRVGIKDALEVLEILEKASQNLL